MVSARWRSSSAVRNRISSRSTFGSGSRSTGLAAISRSSSAARISLLNTWTALIVVAGASADRSGSDSQATQSRRLVRSTRASGTAPKVGSIVVVERGLVAQSRGGAKVGDGRPPARVPLADGHAAQARVDEGALVDVDLDEVRVPFGGASAGELLGAFAAVRGAETNEVCLLSVGQLADPNGRHLDMGTPAPSPRQVRAPVNTGQHGAT